jgi:lipopolysaccharide export system permease protein
MRRLNRYLISSIVKLLLVCELAGVIIFSTIDFFEHLDVFTQSFSKFLLGLAYLALQIPYYFNLILPLSLLISILVHLIIMIRGNEVIVVRTAGVSTFSLMKPLISFSLALVILSFSLSEWVIPLTSSLGERIYTVKIKQEQTYVEFKNDKIWLKREHTISSIDLFDFRTEEVRGLSVFELADDYSIRRRFDAKRGKWTGASWVFSDVVERRFKNGMIESKVVHATLPGLISEPPSVFKIADKSPDEMSYRELERYIDKLRRNGHDVKRYMVDLYDKISFPFINVIMVLAAFSVGLRYAKAKNVSKGVFFGICLGMAYWFIHSIALSFGYSERFPPLFAALFSNMLFFAFGIIGIMTVKT